MIEFNVVIATFNSAATLERCLESVRAATAGLSCKVVLIDGASQDGTLRIAEAFSDILDVVISEPDSGVYEAWNKGLGYCSHPWVLFLGSDDYLCKSKFLEYLTFVERHQSADFVSCQVKWVTDDGRVIRVVGRPWKWQTFKRYMCSPHPGSFTSMDYIRRVGNFDESLKICGDYELILRAGSSLKAAHWPDVPICMQAGGLSDGIRVLNEALGVKLRAGFRGRIMSVADYLISVAKYLVRTRMLGLR